MDMMEKLFYYDDNQVTVMKFVDEVWFKGKEVAQTLGYMNPCREVSSHVDPDDRKTLNELMLKGGVIRSPLMNLIIKALQST